MRAQRPQAYAHSCTFMLCLCLSIGVRLVLLLLSVFFAMMLHTSFQTPECSAKRHQGGHRSAEEVGLQRPIRVSLAGKSKQQTIRTGDSYHAYAR